VQRLFFIGISSFILPRKLYLRRPLTMGLNTMCCFMAMERSRVPAAAVLLSVVAARASPLIRSNWRA
jgi:hypothetical protein